MKDIEELPELITRKELSELKIKVNQSMEKIVKLVLKANRDIKAIEERLTLYNSRGGHKI